MNRNYFLYFEHNVSRSVVLFFPFVFSSLCSATHTKAHTNASLPHCAHWAGHLAAQTNTPAGTISNNSVPAHVAVRSYCRSAALSLQRGSDLRASLDFPLFPLFDVRWNFFLLFCYGIGTDQDRSIYVGEEWDRNENPLLCHLLISTRCTLRNDRKQTCVCVVLGCSSFSHHRKMHHNFLKPKVSSSKALFYQMNTNTWEFSSPHVVTNCCISHPNLTFIKFNQLNEVCNGCNLCLEEMLIHKEQGSEASY